MINFEGDNDGVNDNEANSVNSCSEVGKYMISGNAVGVCLGSASNPIYFSDETKNIKHLIEDAENGTPFSASSEVKTILKHGAYYFIIDKFESGTKKILIIFKIINN